VTVHFTPTLVRQTVPRNLFVRWAGTTRGGRLETERNKERMPRRRRCSTHYCTRRKRENEHKMGMATNQNDETSIVAVAVFKISSLDGSRGRCQCWGGEACALDDPVC